MLAELTAGRQYMLDMLDMAVDRLGIEPLEQLGNGLQRSLTILLQDKKLIAHQMLEVFQPQLRLKLAA